MIDFAGAAFDNLRAPMVLFFALGLGAALLRSDLAIPESVAKALALYLMMAIGFKGGAALIAQGIGWQAAATLLAGVAVGLAIPVLGFALLRRLHGVGPADAAAIAAYYGSISVVTFVTAAEFLNSAASPIRATWWP
ncbi:MAG: sodium-dependent bicarbonate transport family permease [Alphaproteobacteria bacterium]